MGLGKLDPHERHARKSRLMDSHAVEESLDQDYFV